MNEQVKRLASLDIENILIPEDPHFKLDDLADKLGLLKSGAQKLLEYTDYWDELPSKMKDVVNNETATLMQSIDRISSTKDDSQWLSSHLPGIKQIISNLYNTLYPMLVAGIREYENSTDKKQAEIERMVAELNSTIKSFEKKNRAAERLSNKATSTVQNSQDLVSDAASVSLSHHFEGLAVGDKTEAVEKNSIGRYLLIWLRLFEPNYRMATFRWAIALAFFILLTAITAARIQEMGFDTIEKLVGHALILAAPAYGIKFCAKNFRETKSLQNSSIHKAVVMKTLLSFLERKLDTSTRDIIISEAAKQVFAYDIGHPSQAADESVIELPVKLK